MTCKAIRQGDQMCCGRCGLQWDIDDPDRPQCLTDAKGGHLKFNDPEAVHAFSDENIAKDALKEMHHIVEDNES